eukprot:7180934-Prorocentrum_lima.AAC.1
MVCVRKYVTQHQMKESGTNNSWTATSRMVICGNFATVTRCSDDAQHYQWKGWKSDNHRYTVVVRLPSLPL